MSETFSCHGEQNPYVAMRSNCKYSCNKPDLYITKCTYYL